jgi:hypothetical protein
MDYTSLFACFSWQYYPHSGTLNAALYGVGLRNTLDIKAMHYALDNIWKVGSKSPVSYFP